MKKMIVAGANGFLGKYLCRWFHDREWEVVGLSRNGGVTPEARSVFWDGRSMGDWAGELEGAEVVINLAGKSVNCRYGEKNRNLISESIGKHHDSWRGDQAMREATTAVAEFEHRDDLPACRGSTPRRRRR
jgi:NAD dependent epimerase/dehydratase family enzyme